MEDKKQEKSKGRGRERIVTKKNSQTGRRAGLCGHVVCSGSGWRASLFVFQLIVILAAVRGDDYRVEPNSKPRKQS